MIRPVRSLVHLASLLLSVCSVEAADAPKPNILFILTGDLGWADVGFHGGNAPTRTLDKLATESVELTQHYVYPVCSPTRAAFPISPGRCPTKWPR